MCHTLLMQIADLWFAQRLGALSINFAKTGWLNPVHRWNTFRFCWTERDAYRQNIHPSRTGSISSEADLSLAELTQSFHWLFNAVSQFWPKGSSLHELTLWMIGNSSWSEFEIQILKWTHCGWEVLDIIPHNASFLNRWLQRRTLCYWANCNLNINSKVFWRKSSIKIKVLSTKHMYSKNASLKDKKILCKSQVT